MTEPGYAPVTVLKEVLEERDRQDKKWGEQNHVDTIWNAILGEEVGDVAEQVLAGVFDWPIDLTKLEAELIQVAAVAVAWVQCIRRNRVKVGGGA